jgi:uncharacterized membrane protein YhaH (DUF805 family)
MEWMIMPLKRYADFKGRSRRKEYWMFFLFNLLVVGFLLGMSIAFAPTTGGSEMMTGDGGFQASANYESDLSGSPISMVFMGLYVLYALAIIIPSIAVQVRRFHDQDKSGWMILLGFIPFVGGIILLVFMCLEGTKGPNSYGPDPKGNFSEEVFV